MHYKSEFSGDEHRETLRLTLSSFYHRSMTWDGKQGFQKAPELDSFIVEGMGAMGTVQIERKLGYFEVSQSGHMLPQFVPRV